MREEGPTPNGFDLGDVAARDLLGQAAHHLMGVAVEQAALQGQGHAAAVDRDEVTAHRAVGGLAVDGVEDGIMAILVLDGMLQPTGCLQGIELGLDYDALLGLAQTAAETKHGGGLRLLRRGHLPVDFGQLAFYLIEKRQGILLLVLAEWGGSACRVIPPKFRDTERLGQRRLWIGI